MKKLFFSLFMLVALAMPINAEAKTIKVDKPSKSVATKVDKELQAGRSFKLKVKGSKKASKKVIAKLNKEVGKVNKYGVICQTHKPKYTKGYTTYTVTKDDGLCYTSAIKYTKTKVDYSKYRFYNSLDFYTDGSYTFTYEEKIVSVENIDELIKLQTEPATDHWDISYADAQVTMPEQYWSQDNGWHQVEEVMKEVDVTEYAPDDTAYTYKDYVVVGYKLVKITKHKTTNKDILNEIDLLQKKLKWLNDFATAPDILKVEVMNMGCDAEVRYYNTPKTHDFIVYANKSDGWFMKRLATCKFSGEEIKHGKAVGVCGDHAKYNILAMKQLGLKGDYCYSRKLKAGERLDLTAKTNYTVKGHTKSPVANHAWSEYKVKDYNGKTKWVRGSY